MVNFDKDCFFVSQLKKGYMLEKYDTDSFRVIKTGYPYPDTPMLSQDMVNSLVTWLGINRDVSVTELASYFDSFYDIETLNLSKDELKSIIENKSIGVLGSCTGFSTFFSCQFFSIYYIEDLATSQAFDCLKDHLDLPFSDLDSHRTGFVLHYHKGKQKVKLGLGTPAEEVDCYKKFRYVFEKVALLPPEVMSNYLDTLYTILPNLKLTMSMLNPCSAVESFVFKQIHSFDVNALMQTFNSLYSSVISILGLHTLCYKSRTLLVSPVRTTFELIWGYNIFYDLTMPHELARSSFFNIGLLCSLYSCTESRSLRNEYKIKLTDFIDRAVKVLVSTGYYETTAGVIDGDVVIMHSPHIYWFYYRNRTTINEFLDRGVFVLNADSDKRGIIRSDKFGIKYAENLGYILRDYVSPFENKLFQYFLMSFKVYDIKDVRHGHTEFSLRNVLKTFIPAFDRKVLLGGICETDFKSIFTRCYHVAPPTMTVLSQMLDNALDETSIFEEYEKSFIEYILYLGHSVIKEKPYAVLCFFCGDTSFRHLEDVYVPHFSAEQLERFSTVFKMYALALLYSECDDWSALLKDYQYNFSYSDGTFTMEFKEK